jgi:hypothetical protein
MSNIEYLNTILGKFGLTAGEIIIIMIENDIDPDAPMTGKADTIALKKAVYNQLPLMLAGLQDVSEGGYSVKWNVDGIKLWYSTLAVELGLPDILNPTPTITGVSPW